MRYAPMIALLLSACAAQPTVGPWIYDFTLVRVRDMRPDDDAKLMAAEPFSAAKFGAAWKQVVQTNIFSVQPAKLYLGLAKYETTRSGNSFAMSMETRLYGTTADGLTIAATPARCMVYDRSTSTTGLGALKDNLVADVTREPHSPAGSALSGPPTLTASGRDATIWNSLWIRCVAQIAETYGNAMLAGPDKTQPSTPASP